MNKKNKKMMGGYGMKKKMYGGAKRMKAQGGLGIGSPYIYDSSTGRYTLYATKEAARKAAEGRRGVRVGDSLDADDYKIYKSQGAANPKKEKTPAKTRSTTKAQQRNMPNSTVRVREEGRKVSRTPKEGMFYVTDEDGNYAFYPKSKFNDASMRTAAEKMLPGSAGKVSQGTVDDIFMKERPDRMKKMKTPKPAVKSKTAEDIGIQKSKEIKFDAPAKPKADGSKDVAKSKVDAAKAKQAKKTQRATDRAAKKAKAPSMRAEKRTVRQNTRQQIQDIKREGRQERKAIRRGMAEAGMGSMKKAKGKMKDRRR